eukprot:FR735667.1.p1 GENE.FR735667.1~~FR735667.1.p1  ORF type:complete len:237 (+),score=20.93 FR735667.1:95-712(+)
MPHAPSSVIVAEARLIGPAAGAADESTHHVAEAVVMDQDGNGTAVEMVEPSAPSAPSAPPMEMVQPPSTLNDIEGLAMMDLEPATAEQHSSAQQQQQDLSSMTDEELALFYQAEEDAQYAARLQQETGVQVYETRIPQGVRPGQRFRIRLSDGSTVELRCPPSSVAGDLLRFQVGHRHRRYDDSNKDCFGDDYEEDDDSGFFFCP